MKILTQALFDQRIIDYITEWSNASNLSEPLNLWIPIDRLCKECELSYTIFRNQTEFKQQGRYYKCINPDPDWTPSEYDTDCDSDEDGDEIIHISMRVPYIPEGVHTLQCSKFDLSSCILPASLRVLDCNNAINIPALPECLLEINCSDGWNTILPPLPSSLRILDCHHSAIHCLPPLPPNLEYLNYEATDILEYIVDLPPTLKILRCGSNGYTSLGPMPPNLEHFSCRRYEGSLPEFPPSIKTIDIPKYTAKFIRDAIVEYIESWRQIRHSSTIIDFNPLEKYIEDTLKSEDIMHYLVIHLHIIIPYIPDEATTIICSKSIRDLPKLPCSVQRVYYTSGYPFGDVPPCGVEVIRYEN